LRHLDLDPEVETWTDLRDRSKGSLGSAELLFVGGGSTFRLLHHVRSHGFVDAVRDFVAADGDYYGGSAGAILACEDVAIALQFDPNEGGLRDLSSLGLVREFSVFPHFTPTLVAESQSWSALSGSAAASFGVAAA